MHGKLVVCFCIFVGFFLCIAHCADETQQVETIGCQMVHMQLLNLGIKHSPLCDLKLIPCIKKADIYNLYNNYFIVFLHIGL